MSASWRQKRGKEGEDAPVVKYARGKSSAQGGREGAEGRPERGIQEGHLAGAVELLAKLSLLTSQEARRLAAVVMETYLLESKSEAVKVGTAATKDYEGKVRAEGKGHEQGPPHVHCFMAFLDGVVSMLAAAGIREGRECEILGKLRAHGGNRRTNHRARRKHKVNNDFLSAHKVRAWLGPRTYHLALRSRSGALRDFLKVRATCFALGCTRKP